jgi:hypothetical protein
MESKEDIEKMGDGIATNPLTTYTANRMADLSGPSGIAGLVKQPRLLKLTLITTLGAVSFP